MNRDLREILATYIKVVKSSTQIESEGKPSSSVSIFFGNDTEYLYFMNDIFNCYSMGRNTPKLFPEEVILNIANSKQKRLSFRMSYSLDFRKHVFKIKERDSLTFRQTGEHFGISPRTLFKWKKCMEPRLHRNKPATKIDMEAL